MSGTPADPLDRFPGVPVAIARRDRAQQRRERKRLRIRALRLLREARATLDVLSRSEKASERMEAMERAREEVRIAWERWEGLELDRMAELSGRVIYLSEAGIRLRREQDPSAITIPRGVVGQHDLDDIPSGAMGRSQT